MLFLFIYLFILHEQFQAYTKGESIMEPQYSHHPDSKLRFCHLGFLYPSCLSLPLPFPPPPHTLVLISTECEHFPM